MVTTPQKKTISPLLMLLICATLGGVSFSSCNSPSGEPKVKEDGVWIPMPPDTSSLGKRSHYIPIGDLEKYKGRFKKDRDTLDRVMEFTQSEAFNKKALVEVLKDPRCVGIRVYFGVKSNDKDDDKGKKKKGSFRVMIVGVDEQGKDLYIKKGSLMATQGDEGEGGLEFGQCDPPCDNHPPDSSGH